MEKYILLINLHFGQSSAEIAWISSIRCQRWWPEGWELWSPESLVIDAGHQQRASVLSVGLFRWSFLMG